jgi:DNA-directed RNA polymerase subunit beta
MRNSFILPDLVSLQRESFLRFLEKGLPEVLASFTPIKSPTGELELTLYPDQYRLKRPRWEPQEAVLNKANYSAALSVPAQLTDHRTGKVEVKRIFLGDLPLMTDRGHFILNGSPRVIVHQILRCPGVYFQETVHPKGQRTYIASLISNRGAWLRLEIDRNRLIWAKIEKRKKISVFVLLQAMGLSQATIFRSLRNSEFVLDALEDLFQKDQWRLRSHEILPQSREEALLEFEMALRPPRGEPQVEVGHELLYSRFQDPRRYDLGEVGRNQLNSKLGLSIPSDHHTLSAVDVLAITDALVNLACGNGELDDIDHLKNRRVRSPGELIQSQFQVGMTRLERIILNSFGRPSEYRLTLTSLVNPRPIVGAMREFFGSSQLSQFMDQTNPLAEITHKRRLSSLGPGGVNRDHSGMAVREIHTSHYGRICPIETPEGKNAGLIGSLATYARTNDRGFLQSPFYAVEDKMTKYELGPVFLTADQEELVRVSPGDILGDPFPNQPVSVRYQREFILSNPEEIQYCSLSPTQVLSVATSLIPFLEHDDANRALMGSNMQRQAVPLLRPAKPIVGTGLEAQVALDSGSVIQAVASGQVVHVESARITLHHGSQSRESHYFLQSYQRSNQNTCIHQRPAVDLHEWVNQGDLLADGAATAGGEIALGQNLIIAYMPWEGYNFEDSILVSERLIYEDLYTSLHIERYEVEARETKFGFERITNQIPGISSKQLERLDENGLVKPGTWVKGGDLLVGKVTPKKDADPSPEMRLVRAIFGGKPLNVRDTSLRVPLGVEGRVVDVRILQGKDLPGNNIAAPVDMQCMVHVYLCQKRRIQIGDKMAGRHGNKGIVSQIVPRQDMPYCQDGTPVDMVLNPLGVPSRMNVGQVYEALLGLAGARLGEYFRLRAFDELYGTEASRGFVYSKLYEASQRSGQRWLFNPASIGKSRLVDGRTGEAFDQPVTVGQAYMLKLVHQVDDKIHARSTGPYSLVTQQPLGGRSKHGGQRFGEMEVWALEGYGAAYTLQELLTVKSDDIEGRNDAMNALVIGQPIPSPGTPESFKVLVRELRSLCLDIDTYKVAVSGSTVPTHGSLPIAQGE